MKRQIFGKSPRAQTKEGSVVEPRAAKPAVIESELVCTAWEPCRQHAGERRGVGGHPAGSLSMTSEPG